MFSNIVFMSEAQTLDGYRSGGYHRNAGNK
jgi:hypothetical protein